MSALPYLRYVQWPWALALAIVLPILSAWLVRWGLRARRDRLARLGTPSMIARLAPSLAGLLLVVGGVMVLAFAVLRRYRVAAR